jgi:hypothetical protein
MQRHQSWSPLFFPRAFVHEMITSQMLDPGKARMRGPGIYQPSRTYSVLPRIGKGRADPEVRSTPDSTPDSSRVRRIDGMHDMLTDEPCPATPACGNSIGWQSD